MKNNKGVTLVALVVTIIVLIILAAISIRLVLGDNGIIKKAQQAEEEYKQSQENEQKDLNDLYSSIMIATNDSAQITMSVTDLKKIISEETRKELQTNSLGFPDYQNRTLLQRDTDYVADENMWIILDTTGYTDKNHSQMLINIDGVEYAFYQGWARNRLYAYYKFYITYKKRKPI